MKLKNLNIVCFESRHAQTMANLIRLQDGNPFLAPSMKEIPLESNGEVFSFGEKLFSGEIDVLILLTGVGAKFLLSVLETRHPQDKILEALRKTTIVPRGPKPIRVLNDWKVPFHVTVPEPNTWKELVETLDQNKEKIPLIHRVVAVQEYGAVNDELIAALNARQAKVLRVPVYRWALPDELQPLKDAITGIAQGKMDVAIFTTAVQIDHVLQVAKTMGLEEKVRQGLGKMAIASVGPDCSAALRNLSLLVDIEPESPKMGPLVLAVAERAAKILKQKRK